ncbi:CmcJ/NvfI family oxidoreductase [Pseudorhodoplanes sp.]|uniref:CmcJ/NvfI family oxidoreductase n=1 Tax=Pseudorhodoplanes sp. TaxID=1934341 RepID=UPI00391AEE69
MPQLATKTREVASIEATLNYVKNDGQKIVVEPVGGGSTEMRTLGTIDPHNVVIRNGRKLETSLDGEGFLLAWHETAVSDFFDDTQIRDVYYPEIVDLIKIQSGAKRVVIFDHTLRTADDADRQKRKIREVVPRVHNDYTEWSGPQRVRDLLPDEAGTLLAGHFAIIQVWRPIRYAVETYPLALCDAQTISPNDLIVTERRHPDRIGQTYSVSYNPDHRWFWFPLQRREEAIVFKVYDSLKDGRARFCAHTAFDDPTSPADARPRESIEIRTLAFF